MTSQDGTPVPGPYTFPVIVCWKPSTCSESRVGVLRNGIMTEGMRDREDVRRSGCVTEEDVSFCFTKVQVLWYKTYHRCSSLCSGV